MTRAALCLVSLLWLGAPDSYGCGALQIENAWIREPPPMADVAAGFLELRNPSVEPVEIVSVDSGCCGSTGIHRTVIENDRARMVHQSGITVPAHGKTLLEPGGLHIMLMDPKVPLLSGQWIELTIRCASGGPVTAKALVRRD